MKATIILISILFLFACKKKKTETPLLKTGSEYFIRPTLDGVYSTFEVNQNNTQMYTWLEDVSSTSTTMVRNYCAGIGQTQENELGAAPTTVLPGIYFVGFGAVSTSDSLPNAEFHAVLGAFNSTAFYDYDIENQGFYIFYGEGEYSAANSFYGSQLGDQTGSSFSITSNVALPDYGAIAQRKITGTVSCKLYNYDDETMVKTLTSAPFSIIIQNVK
jgi:hypothetical protein